MNIGILSSKRASTNSSLSHSMDEVTKRRSMCMLIGDGILMPAISVLSAMDGLRAPFPSVSKSLVEALSATVLVVLFLLQQFGTSQIAFFFTIYLSLVLTYAGQTAYLTKNPNDHDDGFYKFIPTAVYWPIFIVATSAAIVASQSLISATFSVIKQSVVLDYFPRVKVVHTSCSKEGEVYSPEVNYILMILCVAVILIFGDGKDIGNAFGMFALKSMKVDGFLLPYPLSLLSLCLAGFMGDRKMEYELTHKITLDRLGMLLSDPSVRRVPGLCFFYTNIQDGLTPVLGHYIKNMKSLHKVTILTTLRYSLGPKVAPHERIVIKKLGLEGVYGCVVHYGYADSLNLDGDDFVGQVTSSLRVHIQNCSDGLPSSPVEIQEEISDLEQAKQAGVAHVRGKTRFYIGKSCSWFDRIMLAFYELMHNNCRSALPALGVPLQQRIDVGMLYEA
ncbi:hypothetical protein FH972_012732 [Carpinus fangiana]|uniref:Potassium transporter n=1 Tax=Carpinus fangiana TaxID=176857 RepID=A0A5N6R691_9ROSI|nr:hypothetical protein FH972_012732 [Carpinus fangiana]